MAAGALIKHKRKTSAFTTSELGAGEIGVDTTSGIVYYSTDGTSVFKLASVDVTTNFVPFWDGNNFIDSSATDNGAGIFIINAATRGSIYSDGSSLVSLGDADNNFDFTHFTVNDSTQTGTLRAATVNIGQPGFVINLGDWENPFTGQIVLIQDGVGILTNMDMTGANFVGTSFDGNHLGTWSGNTITASVGGTGQSSYAQGDLLYASGTTSLSKLAKNTSASRYLSNTGTSNNPAWAQIDLSNGVTGTLPVGNGGTGITALGTGVATALGINVGSAGAFVTFNGALGTPSSGTLTNCSGLPLASVTDSTSEALGVGTLEIGHASDTTLARVSAGVASLEGKNIALNGTSEVLTTGTIELGAASDTTLARASAGVVSIEGVNILTVAGGTLTGKIHLGEGVDPATIGIQLDESLSADERYSGIVISATAGATIVFGDLCYLDVTAGEWLLADADAASTSGDVPLGICVDASTDGNATSMLLIGTVRSAAFPASIALGAPVYVSTTAGDIQATQPSGTDDVIRRVGWAITAEPNTIYFNPSTDYITHT